MTLNLGAFSVTDSSCGASSALCTLFDPAPTAHDTSRQEKPFRKSPGQLCHLQKRKPRPGDVVMGCITSHNLGRSAPGAVSLLSLPWSLCFSL